MCEVLDDPQARSASPNACRPTFASADVKARAFPKSGFELPDLFEDTLITLNIVLIYHHPKPYSRQYFLLFRSRAYPFKELLW